MNYATKKFLTKVNKIPIFIPILITMVSSYGFLILYAAAGGNIKPWAYKQLMMFFLFMPVAFFISLIDIRTIYRYSYHIYFISLSLLLIVQFAGKRAMGATRWIDLGIFRLQPSELMKIAVVLALARIFHNMRAQQINKIISLFPAIMAVVVPAFLVIIQPDLGTGMVIVIVSLVMFFALGVHASYFIYLAISITILLPILWNLLHNYQKNRILIFLDPEKEPLGAGYNIIQSKIAIGSGGLLGKGLMEGTQSHLNFLPEHQTDFVFAFLAEELGFIGGCILLTMYLLIIVFSLAIAINVRTKFGKFMVIGIVSIFSCHVFVNIGMVMGMLPVVGVPLPFVSYGGTMMVSMLTGFGLVMNASVNQYNNI